MTHSSVSLSGDGHDVSVLRSAGYEPVSELARGVSGDVYVARRTVGSSGRSENFAVKLIRVGDGQSTGSAELLAARAQMKLEHPNILRIYEIKRIDDVVVIVMPLVAGSLADRESWSSDFLLEIAIQLSGALNAVHERDLVHGDVKPHNILVDHSARNAFLTDFGMMTRPGPVRGFTPLFAAPEVRARPNAIVTSASDIYSLAVTIFWAAGLRPTTGIRDDGTWVVEIFGSVESNSLDPFARLLLLALSTDPEQRPTASSLLDELLPLRKLVQAGKPLLTLPPADKLESRLPNGRHTSLLTSVMAPAAEVASVVRKDEVARGRRSIASSALLTITSLGLGVLVNVASDSLRLEGITRGFPSVLTILLLAVAVVLGSIVLSYGRIRLQRHRAGSMRVQALDVAARLRKAYVDEIQRSIKRDVSIVALRSFYVPALEHRSVSIESDDWI